MADTIESLITGLATAHGGPLAGLLAGAVIRLGTAELERRAGKRLHTMSREEALALLDSLEIGVTADEIAEGRERAVKNAAAKGTPDDEA